MFAIDEAALQDNFIDFKVVPGLKNELNAAKDDLLLSWAMQMAVHFPVLTEATQIFLVLFGSTWSYESGFSAMNQSHQEQPPVPTQGHTFEGSSATPNLFALPTGRSVVEE